MALRTFRSNPSLGGFGSESTGVGLHQLLDNEDEDGSMGKNSSNAVRDCDAFAQIIKELVDNAVDACSVTDNSADTGKTENHTGRTKKKKKKNNKKELGEDNDDKLSQRQTKRVRVVIEEYVPPSEPQPEPSGTEEDRNSQRDQEDSEGDIDMAIRKGSGSKSNGTSRTRNRAKKSTNDEASTRATCQQLLLRVTVSDNGCGMENIQECVEAFKSTKAGRTNHTTGNGDHSQEQQQQQQQPEAMTAGRYGIGLTLCLLHAQRLVPNSCASITSATDSVSHFTKASYVVDTEEDSVRCVELQTNIAKTTPKESGTSVSILVPGGATAKLAWPRLAEYFARFQLSCGLACSLEVMAPTLSKVPLFVRPPPEQRNRRQRLVHGGQKQELSEDEAEQSSPLEDAIATSKHDSCRVTSKSDDKEEMVWRDVFDDHGEVEGSDQEKKEGDDRNDKEFQVEEEEWAGVFDDQDKADESNTPSPNNNDDDQYLAALVTPSNMNTTKRDTAAAAMKALQEQKRQDMYRAVELYLGHSVDFRNVAMAQQPIRIGAQPTKRSRGRAKHTGPSLEVTMVVCGAVGEEQSNEDDLNEDGGRPQETSSSAVATMMVVRLVNRLPLLDGAEASSCGLVQGLLLKKKVWNSFGLEVSSNGLLGFSSQPETIAGALKLPTFQVRDSDQVAPFLKNANHALFEDPFDEDETEDSNSENDPELDVEDALAVRGKRKRKKKRQNLLLPAGVRLGKVLVVVQIDAEPSSLPLPTLSKGRLPVDNVAIDRALEVAVLECLRGLQKTNPDILLTAQQLKRADRDARYVPAVASSIASIIANSTDSKFRSSMTSVISKWGCNAEVACGEEDYTRDNEDGDDARSQIAGFPIEGANVFAENLSSSTSDGLSAVNRGGKIRPRRNTRNLARKLGGNIESRLRRVLASHEEASKKKRKKPKKRKEVQGGGDKRGNDASITSKQDPETESVENKSDAGDDQSEHSNSSLKDPYEMADSPSSKQKNTDDMSQESPHREAATRCIFDDDDDDWWADS